MHHEYRIVNHTLRNRIVLGGSLLAFLLIFLHEMAGIRNGFSGFVHLGDFSQSLLLSFFLLGSGYFIYRLFSNIEFFNVEELLGYLILVGLLTLLFNVLPEMLIWGGVNWNPHGYLELIYYSLALLSILFYIYLGSVLFLRLTKVQHSKWGRRTWYFLLSILICSLGFNFFDIDPNNTLYWIFLGFAACALFLHFIRLTWIALLSSRVKLYTIALMLVVVLISLGITQKLYNYPLASYMGITLPANTFLLITIGFVNGYGLFSLAALLFNLPIAAVMDEKHTELEGFREISKVIEENSNQQEILKLLFKRSLENTHASGGWIAEIDPKEQAESILMQQGIHDKDLKRLYLSLSSNRRHFSIDVETNYLYIKDFRQDKFLKNHDIQYRSMVIFPITINHMPIAKLYLAKPFANGFDEYAIDLVLSYVVQTKLSIYNANLLRQTLESERMKKDLEIGKSQQKRLLPDCFPTFDQADIAAMSIPAEEVGGDYYDYYELNGNRTAFIMADVSGKGTLAAFHVAEMKGIFQSLVLQNLEPAEFLIKSNQAVSRCFDKGMFITLIYIIFNWEKQEAIYARAGHCPVIFFDKEANKVSTLQDEGLGLGILRNENYDTLVTQQRVKYKKGDLLILLTDGVLEARNEKKNEEFGMDRLLAAVRSYNYMPVNDLLKTIIKQTDQFAEGTEKHDDLSLLIFKMK